MLRPLKLMLCILAAPSLGDPTTGGALFQQHCETCHGPDALGDDHASDITGASASMLRRALGGLDEMPGFVFTDDDITALETYLSSLSN